MVVLAIFNWSGVVCGGQCEIRWPLHRSSGRIANYHRFMDHFRRSVAPSGKLTFPPLLRSQ